MDDLIPAALAEALDLPVVEVPLNLDGGNLLSNGRGLCLTTSSLMFANPDLDVETVEEVLAEYTGCDAVVILEPLEGEETGHVDMFATFTDPHTVVVGDYDVETDAGNAEVLERNVATLRSIGAPFGPLRVERVPMPEHDDDFWPTYTNVVFANGVLLVPVYGEPDDREEEALELFDRLLPGWRIEAIDVEDLAADGGALHCVTVALPDPGHRLSGFWVPQGLGTDTRYQ